jgi:hypothetical protein
MSWHILYWNQEKVWEALQGGEYDDVGLTGWGRLDDLMAPAEGLGILKELHQLHPELTREGSIPRWFIHHALFLRTVVGDESFNAMRAPVSIVRPATSTSVSLFARLRRLRDEPTAERRRHERVHVSVS